MVRTPHASSVGHSSSPSWSHRGQREKGEDTPYFICRTPTSPSWSHCGQRENGEDTPCFICRTHNIYFMKPQWTEWEGWRHPCCFTCRTDYISRWDRVAFIFTSDNILPTIVVQLFPQDKGGEVDETEVCVTSPSKQALGSFINYSLRMRSLLVSLNR